MSTLNELRDAIDHISTCTGDPQAWQRGLSAADLSAISASVIDPAAATALLAKIRANNAALFDPRTGAPVPPAAPADPPPGQQGDAATAICQLAEELDAAAIVIGSRGRGGIKRAVLGSVSDHVVRNAPCTVIVTGPKGTDED